MMNPSSPTPPFSASRAPHGSINNRPHRPVVALVCALVGSFALTWGFVALGVASQIALGGDFHEAEVAMLLLAFPVFLPLFLWAFASPHQKRVRSLLFCGAGLMTAGAWALQRAVLI